MTRADSGTPAARHHHRPTARTDDPPGVGQGAAERLDRCRHRDDGNVERGVLERQAVEAGRLHLDQDAGGRRRQLDAVRNRGIRLDRGDPTGQARRRPDGRDKASVAAADHEDAVAETGADHLRNQVRMAAFVHAAA